MDDGTMYWSSHTHTQWMPMQTLMARQLHTECVAYSFGAKPIVKCVCVCVCVCGLLLCVIPGMAACGCLPPSMLTHPYINSVRGYGSLSRFAVGGYGSQINNSIRPV